MAATAATRGRLRDIPNDRYSDWHGVTEVVRYAASGITVIGTLTLSGGVALADQNITTGTSTGTQFGVTACCKIGFYGTTPVVQPGHIADTCGCNCATVINAILADMAELGLHKAC